MVLSVRTVPAGAETKMRADGAFWSHADEEKLRALIFAATDIHAIAQKLDRTPLAVRQRAKKLGLTFRKIVRRGCSRPLSIHNLSRRSDWLDPNGFRGAANREKVNEAVRQYRESQTGSAQAASGHAARGASDRLERARPPLTCRLNLVAFSAHLVRGD